MRVFITGVTGYIGSAVAKALLAKGHQLSALVRGPSVGKVPNEIHVVEGGLADVLTVLHEIEKCEAFVHTAQSHTPDMIQLDENAIEAFTRFRDGDRCFVYTSSVWLLGDSGDTVCDESTPPKPIDVSRWRPPHEKRVLDASRSGFTTAVIRPACVYGGRQGLLGDWFGAAEIGDVVQVVGEGNNKWALCHIDDVASQYVAVVEQKAGGIFHAVDDSSCTLNEMAAAVVNAKGSRSKIERVPAEAARLAMGPFADGLMLHQQISSLDTRSKLGWAPTHDFMESVEAQWDEWVGS